MKKRLLSLSLVVGLMVTQAGVSLASPTSSELSPELSSELISSKSFTHVSSQDEIVVEEGDGYLVTIPNNNLRKSEASLKIDDQITPMGNGSSSHILNYNKSGTFKGDNSNGTKANYGSITMSNTHNTLPMYNDYLHAYGTVEASYTGSSPKYASSITITPKQTITASDTVLSLSVPGAATINTVISQCVIQWPTSTAVYDKDSAKYLWDQWNLYTGGHFTECRANDTVNWQFGTTTMAQSNEIRVTIKA